MEGGPYVDLAFRRNNAPVIFDDLFADRKTYTRTGVFMFAVQALEHLEDLYLVFGLESDAVVGNGDVVIKS